MLRVKDITIKLILCIATTVLVASSCSSTPSVKLPGPKGRFSIGYQKLTWIDNTRAEDITMGQYDRRRVHTDFWFPSVNTNMSEYSSYINNRVLGPFIKGLDSTITDQAFHQIGTHYFESYSMAEPGEKKPILFFSAGGNVPVKLYTAYFEYFASRGYVICAVSHTYANPYADAAGKVYNHDQEFYKNQWTENVQSSWDRILELIQDATMDEGLKEIQKLFKRFPATENVRRRAADIQFVLDKLYTMNRDSGSLLFNQLDFNRVYGLGHSFGGAVMGQLATQSKIIRAVVNLDGWQFGDAASSKFNCPLLWIQGDHSQDIDLNDVVYLNNDATYYKLSVKETKHFNFSDLPFILNKESAYLTPRDNLQKHTQLCKIIERFFQGVSRNDSLFLGVLKSISDIKIDLTLKKDIVNQEKEGIPEKSNRFLKLIAEISDGNK